MTKEITMNPSGFVLISDYVPGVIQEIRYHSTYNFVLWGIEDQDIRRTLISSFRFPRSI